MGRSDPGIVGASAIFDDAKEEAVHLVAMKALAHGLGRPLDEVRPVYEKHYSRLKADARVGQYLPLLTTRRTRDELQRRTRHGNSG
jgi:F0F1-type ATP synthase gamma subunit